MSQGATAEVSAVQGLGVVIALVPLIAAYIAIAAGLDKLLHTSPALTQFLFAGFLFSLYWGGIKAMARDQFLPALIGSLGGISTAYALHALPAVAGTAGLAAAMALIALSIYLLVRGMATMLVNNAFMLLLTVGCCLAFKTDLDYAAAAGTIVIAAAYMGGLLLIVGRIAALRAAKA